MQKHALAIHDLSCVGRCSLTAALPILSAAGINTSVIPTALLSTQTGGFTGYTYLDLSEQLLPIARHFHSLGMRFDTIYTGYLANVAQCDMIGEIIRMLRDDHTHVLIDPVFGDNGQLYHTMEPSMPQKMLELCRLADTIVPNITEASLMLGLPYPDHIHEQTACEDCLRLREMGIHNIIITDIRPQKGKIGIAYYGGDMKEPAVSLHSEYKGTFHGAGDTFASFLLGAIINGNMPFEQAAMLALSMIEGSIQATIREHSDTRCGLCFEMLLGEYIEKLRGE